MDPEPSFCDSYDATCGGVMTCGDGTESCALADCATWWAAAAAGTDGDTSVATQSCYTYHLSVAATDAASADVHCAHAKGEAVCVGGDATPADVDVSIKGFKFNQAHITVAVGTTVTWTNNDSSGHTVSSTDSLASNKLDFTGPLDSPTLLKGGTYSHTFETPGVYTYRCKPHSSMKGSVTVQ